MAYSYDPPLTESEKERLTEAIVEDLVYRTGFLAPEMMKEYIQRIQDIWIPVASVSPTLSNLPNPPA